MLREQSGLIVQIHKLLDIFLTAMAFIAAYFIKLRFMPETLRGLTTDPNYYIVLLMIIIIWYVTFNLFGLYNPYRKRTFEQIFWNLVKAVSACMLVLVLCMYIAKIKDVSRIMMCIFFLLNIGFLTLNKGVAYNLLTHYRKKGFNFRNNIIVGSKSRARDFIDAVSKNLDAGYRISGCLEIDTREVGTEVKGGIKVIDTIDHLEKILFEQVVDELVFAMPLKKIEKVEQYIALAEEIGVSVRIIPDWQIHKFRYRPNIATIQIDEFLGIPTMVFTTTSLKRVELLIKTAFDYFFSAITIIPFLPIFLVTALVIKVSSKGPVFFRQERCGLNGRRFMVYKFRTMVTDAEERQDEIKTLNEADGPVFKIRKDPRIIPYIGTLLRKAGLDELPQLINVLRGEMSLIGPRPPIPAEVEDYEIWQRRRLSMKPGLTCLWQTTLKRNGISFNEWMNLDLKYIDNWSLGMDFKILLNTVRAVILGTGQ